MSSAELQVYEVKVRSFWVHLHDFSQRVEDTKDKIDKTVRLYEFFDKVRVTCLCGALARTISMLSEVFEEGAALEASSWCLCGMTRSCIAGQIMIITQLCSSTPMDFSW